ncbi:uncharacterized protein LOC111042365 [Myzus persicae]|uniref:uncharacterized protein LOC111042365 n=1 Tax=Myzus persicae TaxID=13164 RepID=UPI000B93695B|nr:uncharacterized protein LOC111042365 [Myzus persicae]
MSESADEPRPEQGDVIPTQRPADNIDWSQFYDMFMKIEQRLPDFDHMLMAMNDYAFQRTSRQRQTNDLIEFCGVLKKGFIDWYTSNINDELKVPNFIDLTSQVFDDDILKKIEKKLVSITSPDTDTSKLTDTCANTDTSESTKTITNTDAGESTNTIVNTDASESANTSPNTDACKNTDTGANTDDSESTSTSANANASESTNTSTNSDASKSTPLSANTFIQTRDGTCVHKRAKSSIKNYAEMLKYSKYFYTRTESRKITLNGISQSTGTNVDSDQSFKIIMPTMADYHTYLRRRLPVDRNIHLGNDYDRHWWRQTNDKIILNLDISDLVVDMFPNIKVVVTIVGFKVKVRRRNKWITVLSNKFEKCIRKSKWAVNKYMHVKITMSKKEKEFWSKCLVTETRELDTSNFKNHFCSKKCTAPRIHTLKYSSTKKECLKNLTAFLKREYGLEEFDSFMDVIESTAPPTTEETPRDSAKNLKLSVDPSTEKSLNSDSEDLPDTKESPMDLDDPPNLAV